MVVLRSVPKSPLMEQLHLATNGEPQPSQRTLQFLRFYDLADQIKGDPQKLLDKVQEVVKREPSADKIYAVAELSFLEAKRVEGNNAELAINFYGASALHAYQYLFDERYRPLRNPYDPQFRGACDLYNGALESGLRLVAKNKGLAPGQTYTIRTASGSWDIVCSARGGSWRQEDFGRFEFASDYEIKGLKNHYQSYGLGVPMIAVRRSYQGEPAAARYYPADLSFPVTAFIRPASAPVASASPAASGRFQGVLEFYDPLAASDIVVGNVHVPLESDLTTPLAYFLSNPSMSNLADAGLFHPEALFAGRAGGSTPIMGLYMVQPYEPEKIPVLLVHGLWSSPMTWMAMFNDLRSCPEIRDRYQFWFYLYPTAQPFWTSAAMLRKDLADLRQVLDPERKEPALDQMILIGHSMGGLLSRMQTVDSHNDFWNLVSEKSLDQLKVDPQIRGKVQYCFYFEPNPSIRRIVTIATPCRGSSYSNQTTQWLATKLIHLPEMIGRNQEAIVKDNASSLRPDSLLKIRNSIDSLSPKATIFPVLVAAKHPPWVRYNNIVGVLESHGMFGSFSELGDGVVGYTSAHMDDTESELTVPADHMTIHSHPLAVLEVRRILLQHLAELRGVAPVASHTPYTASAPQNVRR